MPVTVRPCQDTRHRPPPIVAAAVAPRLGLQVRPPAAPRLARRLATGPALQGRPPTVPGKPSIQEPDAATPPPGPSPTFRDRPRPADLAGESVVRPVPRRDEATPFGRLRRAPRLVVVTRHVTQGRVTEVRPVGPRPAAAVAPLGVGRTASPGRLGLGLGCLPKIADLPDVVGPRPFLEAGQPAPLVDDVTRRTAHPPVGLRVTVATPSPSTPRRVAPAPVRPRLVRGPRKVALAPPDLGRPAPP